MQFYYVLGLLKKKGDSSVCLLVLVFVVFSEESNFITLFISSVSSSILCFCVMEGGIVVALVTFL